MDISYRYIDAKSYDRIFDIRNKIGSYAFSDDDMSYLQVIKIRKDSEKFRSLSNVIEHRLCKRYDFPLMIRNLPPVAEFSDSDTPNKVRAVDVKNTFAQFDDIEKFVFVIFAYWDFFLFNNQRVRFQKFNQFKIYNV
jgi:hypothetical protein